MSQKSLSSSRKEDSAFTALLLLVVVAAAISTYSYYSTHLPSQQPRSVIGGLQLRSTAVEITMLDDTGLILNVNAVVFNPNIIGATLNTLNYSVYANGHYLGSGQTTRRYDVIPYSSQTLTFPISIGWNSAFETIGSYILGFGHVTWKVNGTANFNVGGLSLSAPFEFITG